MAWAGWRRERNLGPGWLAQYVAKTGWRLAKADSILLKWLKAVWRRGEEKVESKRGGVKMTCQLQCQLFSSTESYNQWREIWLMKKGGIILNERNYFNDIIILTVILYYSLLTMTGYSIVILLMMREMMIWWYIQYYYCIIRWLFTLWYLHCSYDLIGEELPYILLDCGMMMMLMLGLMSS